MKPKSFQDEVTIKHGDFYSSQVEMFFTKAVEFAMKEKIALITRTYRMNLFST